MNSAVQSELSLAPAPVADPNIANLIEILDAELTWLTAAQLLVKCGWDVNDSNKRKLRELANASHGKIISGQRGYRHIRHATADEITHARNWLIHQAKAMADRASEILHQYHQLPHAPQMRTVAVLCCQRKSSYHALPFVDAFDVDRDARSFIGGCPVVAHPPCRAWSAFCSHQAKPADGEKALGFWCVDQVRKWGGILEQPAHSRLWEEAGLPMPGWTHTAKSWSIEVWQSQWGYPMRKATWLYFSNISPLDVTWPLRLHASGRDRRTEQLMSKNQRSKTNQEFARWLVDHARKAT